MLPIVIAGAGIGGLSAAMALAKAGQPSVVLERKAALDEAGAGLQLSPNATRHLREWGILDAVVGKATLPRSIRIRRSADCAELALLPLPPAQPDGAPFVVLHRADLQQVLADAVRATAGIDLRLGAAVSRVQDAETSVAVELDDGSVLTSAGFVAADGARSRLRYARGGTLPRYARRTAWRATVPASAVTADFLRPESNLWLGPKTHLVHYPLRGGSVVNVVAIVEDQVSRPDSAAVDLWSEPGAGPDLLRQFARWHATPRRLIEAAESWLKWPLFDGSGGQHWSSGRTTVLGDAAHPMLPFLAQGASQAIEDAGALAAAVASTPESVTTAFSRYEAIRRVRAETVQAASRRQGQIYHLEGPAALARDAVMGLLGPQRMLKRMDWLYRHQ